MKNTWLVRSLALAMFGLLILSTGVAALDFETILYDRATESVTPLLNEHPLSTPFDITVLNHETGAVESSFTMEQTHAAQSITATSVDIVAEIGNETHFLDNNATGYADTDTVYLVLEKLDLPRSVNTTPEESVSTQSAFSIAVSAPSEPIGIGGCAALKPDCIFTDNGLYVDLPWRAEGATTIPVEAYAHTVPTYVLGGVTSGNPDYLKDVVQPIYEIRIVDDISGNTLATQTFDPPHFRSLELQPDAFQFTIDPESLIADSEGYAHLKAVFVLKKYIITGAEVTIEEGPLSIRLNTDPFPKLPNWYCGDVHTHSEYSTNALEFGSSIGTMTAGADTTELDWLTLTDHSFALFDGFFYEEGTRGEAMPTYEDLDSSRWNQVKAECDGQQKCLIGEEISCSDRAKYTFVGSPGVSHALAYELTEGIPGAGWAASPIGAPVDRLLGARNTLSCQKVIDDVNQQGGFTYAAHPTTSYPDNDLYQRSERQWQDYNLPITGLQIWNGHLGSSSAGGNPNTLLETGLAKWEDLNTNHKKNLFISGGTDAHGDLNLLGVTRTCVQADSSAKDYIFDGLRNGRSYVTNGPALAFDIAGYPIGSTIPTSKLPGDRVLNIGFKSTNEFGNFTLIEIYRDATRIGTIVNPGEKGIQPFTDSIISETVIPKKTFYRLAGYTSKGYQAFTNPIWITKDSIITAPRSNEVIEDPENPTPPGQTPGEVNPPGFTLETIRVETDKVHVRAHVQNYAGDVELRWKLQGGTPWTTAGMHRLSTSGNTWETMQPLTGDEYDRIEFKACTLAVQETCSASGTYQFPPLGSATLFNGRTDPVVPAANSPIHFRVDYNDPKNRATNIVLHLDGNTYTMETDSTNYADTATFEYSTSRAAGTYQYYMEVSVGPEYTRFPATGTMTLGVAVPRTRPLQFSPPQISNTNVYRNATTRMSMYAYDPNVDGEITSAKVYIKRTDGVIETIDLVEDGANYFAADYRPPATAGNGTYTVWGVASSSQGTTETTTEVYFEVLNNPPQILMLPGYETIVQGMAVPVRVKIWDVEGFPADGARVLFTDPENNTQEYPADYLGARQHGMNLKTGPNTTVGVWTVTLMATDADEETRSVEHAFRVVEPGLDLSDLAVNYLAVQQNADSTWTSGAEGDSYTVAAILNGLLENKGPETLAVDAKLYLKESDRNWQGNYWISGSESDVATTANALMALKKDGWTLKPFRVSNAQSWLETDTDFYSAEGYWQSGGDADAYSTASAILALHALESDSPRIAIAANYLATQYSQDMNTTVYWTSSQESHLTTTARTYQALAVVDQAGIVTVDEDLLTAAETYLKENFPEYGVYYGAGTESGAESVAHVIQALYAANQIDEMTLGSAWEYLHATSRLDETQNTAHWPGGRSARVTSTGFALRALEQINATNVDVYLILGSDFEFEVPYNESGNFTFSVGNQGSITSPPVTLEIWRNGFMWYTESLTISAQSTTPISIPYPEGLGGYSNFTIRVNPEKTVHEFNLENNELVVSVKFNRPPQILVAEDITITAGEAAILELTVADPDGDTLQYYAQGALNVEGIWVTDVGDAGTYEARAHVSDGMFEAATNITIDVQSAPDENQTPGENQAPGITTTSPEQNVTIQTGASQTFTIETEDLENDTLTTAWYVGEILQSETADTYTYEPVANGTYLVQAVISDGALSDSYNWTLTVESQPAPREVTRRFEETWDAGSINTSKWKVWGFPKPFTKAIGKDSAYALESNGDLEYTSGVVSYETFNLSERPSVSMWVNTHAQGVNSRVHYQEIKFGFSVATEESYGGTGDQPSRVIEVRVEPQTSAYKVVYGAPGNLFEEPYNLTEDALQWNLYEIKINNDDTISFYKNSVLKYQTTNPIDLTQYENQAFVMEGRSVGTTNLMDSLSIDLTEEGTQVLNTFRDGAIEKNIVFEQASGQIEFLELPKHAVLLSAKMDITGRPVPSGTTDTDFNEAENLLLDGGYTSSSSCWCSTPSNNLCARHTGTVGSNASITQSSFEKSGGEYLVTVRYCDEPDETNGVVDSYTLSVAGQPVHTWQSDPASGTYWVDESAVANINSGNEIKVTATRGSIDTFPRVDFINLQGTGNGQTYPTTPSLDIDAIGEFEWTYTGEFKSTETTPDLSTAIQNVLDSCTNDSCMIPLDFVSNSRGELQVSNLQIRYTIPTPLNIPPTLDSFSPIESTIEVKATASTLFSVSASDVDGDALLYTWTLDGAEVSTAQSYTYAPQNIDIGTHALVATVSDGTDTATQTWNVDIQPLQIMVTAQTTNEPLVGIPIYAYQESGEHIDSIITNAAGTSTFGNLEPVQYIFYFYHQGNEYETGWIDPLVSDTIVIDVSIDPVLLTVQTNTGAPIGGSVSAYTADTNNYGGSAMLDASGLATFTSLSPDTWKFRAYYGGNQYWSDPVTVPAQLSATLTIPVNTATLTAKTSMDLPVQGTAYAYRSDDQNNYGGAAQLDSNGEAIFEGLTDGVWHFRVTYNGDEYWSTPIDIPTETETTLIIPVSSFTLTVQTSTGTPLGGTTYAYRADDVNNYGGSAELDATGTATFQNLAAGSWKFKIHYKDEEYWSSAFQLPGSNTGTFIIPVNSVTLITLTSAGEPLGGTAYAYSPDETVYGGEASLGANGEALFQDLNAGAWKFQAKYEDTWYWSEPITVPDESTASITVQVSTGVTLTASTSQGTPLGGSVSAYREDTGAYGSSEMLNAQGTATFEGLGDGAWHFRAYYQGDEYWSTSILLPEETAAALTVPTTIANIFAATESGAPLGGNVYAYRADYKGNYGGAGMLNAQGETTISDLGPYLWKFKAKHKDTWYWSDPVDVATQENVTIVVP